MTAIPTSLTSSVSSFIAMVPMDFRPLDRSCFSLMGKWVTMPLLAASSTLSPGDARCTHLGGKCKGRIKLFSGETAY